MSVEIIHNCTSTRILYRYHLWRGGMRIGATGIVLVKFPTLGTGVNKNHCLRQNCQRRDKGSVQMQHLYPTTSPSKHWYLLNIMHWSKKTCFCYSLWNRSEQTATSCHDEYHQITQWRLEVTHTSYWHSEPWKRMFSICGCLPMAAQCYLHYECGVENMKMNGLHSRQVKSTNGQLLERELKPVHYCVSCSTREA